MNVFSRSETEIVILSSSLLSIASGMARVTMPEVELISGKENVPGRGSAKNGA